VFLGRRTLGGIFAIVLLGTIYAAGLGLFVPAPEAESPLAPAVKPAVVLSRAQRTEEAARTIGTFPQNKFSSAIYMSTRRFPLTRFC
jgi:hypothetical protein